MTARKIANAGLLLCAGVISLPLMLIVWPLFCAWYGYNETDTDFL